MNVIDELTKEWKSYEDEIVALEKDIRAAHGVIRHLETKIETIQTHIALLQEQE